jgi:hypothetical protein
MRSEAWRISKGGVTQNSYFVSQLVTFSSTTAGAGLSGPHRHAHSVWGLSAQCYYRPSRNLSLRYRDSILVREQMEGMGWHENGSCGTILNVRWAGGWQLRPRAVTWWELNQWASVCHFTFAVCILPKFLLRSNIVQAFGAGLRAVKHAIRERKCEANSP